MRLSIQVLKYQIIVTNLTHNIFNRDKFKAEQDFGRNVRQTSFEWDQTIARLVL
jgi:hypothetical protein